MFRATQPRWIFERLYEQIRAIPSLQFSKYTGLFLEATRAGNSPYSPKVVRSFHVQKASKINKTEEQKKGQRRYNFLHSLTNCTSIGIGLLLGSSTTTTVLTASCEANPDGDVIRLNPWDKEYLSTLVLGSSHKDQITKALRARNGTLNIKGFSDDELRNLANWLKEHYHGFIHLQSDKTQLSNASRTAVKEIETELKKNKDAFQDRSSSQDCADFCVLAYKSLEEIKNSSNLPDGWKVLTCGDNPLVESSKNGYFGIAFVNHKTGNIIIAHRGTEFPNFSSSQNGSSNWLSKINALLELLKDVRADYFGVACLGLDDQQRSAVEFSKKVNDKAKEYNYRVGCVGHSLGGWLAQIAAYTLNDNQNGRGNIYAICLDSPGIKEMITKYYQSKYRMTEEVPLDVVNFTLFPNHVNCFGRHLGTLYQLPLDREILNPQKKINAFDYLMTTHNKEHLRKAIKVSHSEGCFIENWPMIDSVKVSDELANYTTRNTIKASVSTFFDSNNLCEFFTKFCKTGVENVDAGYQAYLQLTEEYRNFRELLSSSNQNDFDRLYRAGYRVKKFDPKVMRICHFDNATRELLVLIQQLRNLGGSEKQMTSFLVEKAKVFGIPSSELLPLLRFQIEKDLLTVDAKGGNAADIRRLACQLLNCFPMETLRKELCEYKYLSFLNDWPQQRVKEILLDDSVSPPTTTYYFESKYSQAIDFIDQMFQESNVVFLYGIPGSGKLEIARCYYDFFINKNSLGKKNIAFFLDASTSEKLEQAWNQISFKQISKIMELSNSTSTQSELFDGVYSTLDSLDEDYLIIFSGVKQPEDLTKYLTQNFLDKKFKGKILVTSEKFSENYSMIDVAEKFPIELNQAYEILKHNNVVDPIVCSLFNTLWNGSSDINNSSKPLRWYQKIIALFVPDSRICEEKAAAKSLKSSPLTVDLVSRYLQNSSLQDSKDFIELLQRTSQQKQILICTIQAIVKALEKDDLTRFLLKTLPLLPHDRISCELIQNWATSNEASMFFSNRQEISRVQNSIQRLEKYGILQPMTGEKADFFYIHPYIYQELKKSFPDKPAYPFLKDNFIDLFFNFISSNMKLENITTDDFRIIKINNFIK
jgi:hypothetical protein